MPGYRCKIEKHCEQILLPEIVKVFTRTWKESNVPGKFQWISSRSLTRADENGLGNIEISLSYRRVWDRIKPITVPNTVWRLDLLRTDTLDDIVAISFLRREVATKKQLYKNTSQGFLFSNGVTGRKHHVITDATKSQKSKFSQQVDGWMFSKITENYPRKCFWTKEKETQVNFNPGLSANRPMVPMKTINEKSAPICFWIIDSKLRMKLLLKRPQWLPWTVTVASE